MAKNKVTLKLDPKIDPKFMFNKQFMDRVGFKVVVKMREFIAKGLSPVKGVGRFEAYAAQRKSEKTTQNINGRRTTVNKKRYPFTVKHKFPSKQTRPVNLSLNDSFLNTISHDASKAQVEIGHIDIDQHTMDLFKAHNEGLNKNVPKRKYLPNKRGEDFVATIKSMIKSIFSSRIKSVLK